MDTLRRAADAGLVHSVSNSRGRKSLHLQLLHLLVCRAARYGGTGDGERRRAILVRQPGGRRPLHRLRDVRGALPVRRADCGWRRPRRSDALCGVWRLRHHLPGGCAQYGPPPRGRNRAAPNHGTRLDGSARCGSRPKLERRAVMQRFCNVKGPTSKDAGPSRFSWRPLSFSQTMTLTTRPGTTMTRRTGCCAIARWMPLLASAVLRMAAFISASIDRDATANFAVDLHRDFHRLRLRQCRIPRGP